MLTTLLLSMELLFMLASLICSGCWVWMLFAGRRHNHIRGIYFETFVFFSIAFAVISAGLGYING